MNSFTEIVQSFFTKYLIRYSKNTIEAYKYSMLSFIEYLKENKIGINNLKIEDITFEIVENYFKWLKEDKKLSDNSINLKISFMKTFVGYIETKTLNGYDLCKKVKSIKTIKVKDSKVLEYLTVEEIKILLSSIKIRSDYNLKELTIISLLYEGAFRVQELCDMMLDDLDFNQKHLRITVIGKGNKVRTISVNDDEKKLIEKYIKVYKCKSGEYLFKNKYNQKYTRKGINYIFKKNYNICKRNCKDKFMFKENPHCHILRHSKAMHLLECDVSIEVIKEFLGHESYSTTHRYAKYSTKKIEEVIIDHSKNIKLNKKYSKKEKETLEKWLKSEF